MATYTLESSQNTTDHLNKHFPTIYKVSQRHTLRDIYRWHNNLYIYHICISVMVIFAKCRLNINPSRSRGQKKGGTYPLSKSVSALPHLCAIRWRESGGVSFKTFKTEKQKQKVFRLQTPLITSWFRENIWMLQMQLFLNLCTRHRYMSRKVCRWLTLYMVGKCLFKWSVVFWEDSSVYVAIYCN
jgi:hypothetical protein